MYHSISLSFEEIQALLCLPFFRRPNPLSPFYELQTQENDNSYDPTSGLALLEDKKCWEEETQELSLLGRQILIPLFAPTTRIMLFSSAGDPTPFCEFYAYKQHNVLYTEQTPLLCQGPMQALYIVDYLREKIFADRRAPLTEHNLNFFEHEFLLLYSLSGLYEERGEVAPEVVLGKLREFLHQDDISIPILGNNISEKVFDILTSQEGFQKVAQTLIQDALVLDENELLRPLPALHSLFQLIRKQREVFMIREEFEEDKLYASEVSIITGEQGYFQGRCNDHPSEQMRLVLLADMEWFTLYQVINEISRSKNYLTQIILEVTQRTRAHLRI